MKNGYLSRIKKEFFQVVDDNKFEKLFYKLFFVAGLGLFIYSGIINLNFNHSLFSICLPFFCAGLMILVHTLFYRKKFNLAALLIIINNNFIFVPFMWISKMGFNGGFQYYLFLFLIATITLLKGTQRVIEL